MKIKEFFEKYDWLKISIQHLGLFGGCWKIEVYNTTWDIFEPVFEHYITDKMINNLYLDFETIIMTPVLDWWERTNTGKEK